MGGTAPANQLRLSFTGLEDGEAETETCRAAKPLWRTATRNSGPRGLNSLNRRMRTRMYGGVAGETGRLLPLSRLPCPAFSGQSELQFRHFYLDGSVPGSSA